MADDDHPTLFDAVRARWRVFAAAGVLAVLAVGGNQLWHAVQGRVAADPRYRITAETIHTTPPPEWVRSDVRSQVLASAGLRDGLSSLQSSGELEQRLSDAFRFHPWVESVNRIVKTPPNQLQVDLTYRTPLLAVGDAARPGELLLADASAVRLPEGDLAVAELRRLPRVTLPAAGVETSRPLRGEPWRDERVRGAVALASGLGTAWWDLGLAGMAPSQRIEVRGAHRYFTYELVSAGGTRIAWGAAPGQEPTGEPPFMDKLQRLTAFVQTNGPLAGPSAPRTIDLRTQRTRITKKTPKEPPLLK